MTDILIILAIVVGVLCLAATLAVFFKVKRTSNDAAANKLEDVERQLARLEGQIANITKASDGMEQRVGRNIEALSLSTETRINELKRKLDEDLKYVTESNAVNLEKIRRTVDDRLATTLEGKLSESYKVINEQLEKVYKGIGEVNSLATGVSDIKKMFSNVKLRGVWGETQLNTLLEQMLSPSQYASQVKLSSKSECMVDFAVKLPSRDDETVWLPIDSKFPIEEYMRLTDAEDKEAAAQASKKLAQAVKVQADSIAEKYINPPVTTDYALMYLPLEALYAEVVKMPELEAHLRKRRVIPCGPTNLGALLSTLQTGFRTAAIEKRSGELWQLLSAFKAEFEKFEAVLEKTGKKLQEAQDIVEQAGKKTRTISRKLKGVADIDGTEADRLLED
ncbi:MAG: DNA recombination protein RmuC [Clostridia bacterium]|nr:DNA recombination protein RmuC [Clostridia bacterium]